MSAHLYLATKKGVRIARRDGADWISVGHALDGCHLTCIAACKNWIAAGGRDGAWRSIDGGRTWNQANSNLTIRYVRWLKCVSDGREIVLAGTEPADIFVSRDGARTWSGSADVKQLRDAHGWFLPYSPEAGCVRDFAAAGRDADASFILAAVETGGILVSRDAGESWRLVEGSDGNPNTDRDLGAMIHPDVHALTVHRSSPGLVTAATGGGLYRSADGGRSWKNIYHCYCRAVWVDPTRADRIVFGPADGVSRNGRIEESRDGGRNWQPAAAGIQTPWPRHMVERLVQVADELVAVLSNGELWATVLSRIEWRRILPDLDDITAAAA